MRVLPLLLLATASCSGKPAAQTVPIVPVQSCVTGTIFSVGTDFDPATIVQLDDGEQVRITGEREGEIRRLSGTVLTACGVLTTDAGIEDQLKAESFELRSVDGMTAYLGTLQEVDGGWQLKPERSGAPVPLSGVPEQLREAEGSLVWVAGTWTDQSFSVKSFGLMERS